MEDQGFDQVQAFAEALTGRRATTTGDEAEELPSEWLPGAGIAAALAVNYAVFAYFGDNYFDWYVANGSKLALALALLSLAIAIDDEPGVIAARPSNYVASWLALLGEGFLWLDNLIRPGVSRSGSVPFWDDFVTILFIFVWAAAAFAWLAVVVPAQYCVNLVCGAPVRLTMANPRDVIVEQRPGRTSLGTKATRVQVGLTVRKKPVTATAAISAATLFALSLAV